MRLAALLLASASLASSHVLRAPRGPPHIARRCTAARASVASPTASGVEAAEPPLEQFGRVLSCEEGVVVVEPRGRTSDATSTPSGELLHLDSGGRVAILFERCGLYFAAQLTGAPAAPSERVSRVGANMTLDAAPVPSDAWAGIFDYLGRPLGAPPAAEGSPAGAPIFGAPVGAAQRRPINSPLHTGVVAVDALTPVGRGQSMLVLGPPTLPPPAGTSELARRVIDAQASLGSGVRTIHVACAEPGGGDAAAAAAAAEPRLAYSRVLVAEGMAQAALAAQAACSLAQAAQADGGGDVLVVIDSLAQHLRLWQLSASELAARGVSVGAEEEGSQQRAFYAALTERAHRAKAGGSLTLLLLQPSPSVHASAERGQTYKAADFVAAGFSERACARVKLLEDKGVALTDDVLERLSIPAPGSGHPQGDGGRVSGQHLEELTSLVDGHVDLREAVAAAGRTPPLDPSNSLTRIGVGSHALRPASTTEAMRLVTRALRLELALAADPAGCEPAQRRRAKAYLAALDQPDTRPIPLGEQVAMLLATSAGLLDDAAERGAAAEILRSIGAAVDAAAPGALDKIGATGYLSAEAAEEIRRVIERHVAERA